VSRFLSAGEVLALHSVVIEESGGGHGVRDMTLLESALGAPQQTFGGALLHADVPAQAAAMLRSIALNHPFVDGNKRTAFMAAYVFLQVNGQDFTAPEAEVVDFMLKVAAGKRSLEEITAWIRSACLRE
jgi:death-on-curing protein